MKQPTNPTERAILKAIRELIKDRGYSPSIRELCAIPDIGVSSTSTMQKYLDHMEQHGFIARTPGISRSIRIQTNRKDEAA
jgi:repressor LexA